MLTIRNEQMTALAEQQRYQFEDRLVAHVRRHFREECAALGNEAVCAQVHDGIARARKHGLGSELDVARFVDVMFGLRPDFDSEPWAAAILGDKGRLPTERMDCVCEQAEREAEARRAAEAS